VRGRGPELRWGNKEGGGQIRGGIECERGGGREGEWGHGGLGIEGGCMRGLDLGLVSGPN
jgi:hypothetical protein